MSTYSSLADRALSALQAAVQSLEARGRVTRIAGVKSEVLRHLPDFNEKTLGYTSFGEFVEAAAEAGAIRVSRDDDGWTRVNSVTAKVLADGAADRLRPDVWRAFTQWGHHGLSVWDRATSRAIRLPVEPRPYEHPHLASLREALNRDDGEAIVINPISMDAQRAWMQDFADQLGDHPLALPLKGALTDSKPFRAFSATLRADDQLRHAFNRARTLHVLEAVREWAAKNDVDLDALENGAPVDRGSVASAAATPSTRDVESADALREALHRAVNEMPIEDLRRIAVPAGYIIDALR
jgi:hypothetical protein